MAKKRHTVLIIEDNEMNREILCEILNEEYNVFSAENGAKGMEILNRYQLDIDIVLLDIQMPVMNGYEVLKAVSNDNILKDIPVVVMTGAEATDEELRCLNLGASDFLRKPYNPTLIHLRLSNIIRLRESMLANRQRTLFVNNISHEMRTPMNAIMGFSQLVAMPSDCISDEDRQKFCNQIVSSTKMLLWMLEDALLLADSENGQFTINREPTFINDVCRKLITMTEQQCPEGVKMYYTTDIGDSFVINTDGDKVQHVLLNFVSNACKWTSEGEIHIHCSITENPGSMTISVSDTGPGVPPDKADIIFEQYTKLNSFKPGNGLGLNIAHIIAELLNAKVYLDTSYTSGARFAIRLPM